MKRKILQAHFLLAICLTFLFGGLVTPGMAIRDPHSQQAPQEIYNLSYSTYFGGSGYEHARDVFVDQQGNSYIVGGSNSTNFPITTGPVFNNGDCQVVGSAGKMDAFIIKLSPAGTLIWSRLLGGPCYDRAYAVEVDGQGYVYLAGRAGPGFPTTANAFQRSFQGTENNIYGQQNAFVAKIQPDGSSVIWASFLGVGQLARDLALDGSGNIYLPLAYSGQGGPPPSAWFTNAYQKDLQGGMESGVVKVKSDGTQVLWATWLGGSGNDTQEASIRIDSGNNVFLAFSTNSMDIPTSPNAYDRSFNGGEDYFAAKINSTGSNLLYGTYLGGSGDEWISTHNLAIDAGGNAYISLYTSSTDFPTTPSAFQPTYTGGGSDIALVKLSSSGSTIQSTYIGGGENENPDGIYVDGAGNVYVTGQSGSSDFPITNNAFQRTNRGSSDAVLVRISSDFSDLLYSTFLGGGSIDDGRSGFLTQNGAMYLVGSSSGPGWPTRNAYQKSFAGGQFDNVIAKFIPGLPPSAFPNHIYLPALR